MPNKHIDLFKEMMPAIDFGMKDLWDAAGEDGQKDIKGDLWNLNRYISSVKGTREEQELAIFKTNEYYNKNWAVLGSKHPKLQWQLLCISGNTKKREFHEWIGFKKQTSGNSKIVKFLSEIYPSYKEEEIEILARISTKKEIQDLARDHGIDDFKF
jgi:hypothetical protein